MTSYKILGIGAACIDLMITVSEDFINDVPGTKGGAEEIDRLDLDRILSLSDQTPLITTGGSSANVIKCLAGLGESCGFFSSLGDDDFGRHYSDYMQRQKIQCLFIPSPHPTNCVLCMITPDGQRTMRFFEGSSLSMTHDQLMPSHFSGVQLLHLDAYSLRQRGLVEHAMQLAKQSRSLISIDLSSFEMIRDYFSILNSILAKYVDIVFANADETRAMTGLDPEEGCFALQNICSIAVVMIGKEGCLVGHNGQILHCPAHPAHLIDSTGAGDYFAGGFLYGYLHQQPLLSCANLGNRLGGLIVEVKGAELPKEKWQEIRSESSFKER
ncbi:MAG: carbohydrate kinase family protein [Chlamydiales bacterium]